MDRGTEDENRPEDRRVPSHVEERGRSGVMAEELRRR
jgi:hypothetical protein